MPWTSKDAKTHCKDCNPSKWATVANAVLAQCKKEGSSDCDGKAIRIANSKSKLEDPVEELVKQALEELAEKDNKDEDDNDEKKKEKTKCGEEGGDGLEIKDLKNNPYKLEVMGEQPITLESKDGKVVSTVQMLKSGKFEHPWFGVLAFDDTVFDNMIKNFDAGIPYQEFALDFRHLPELGAAAWITRAFKEKSKGKKKCDLYFDVEWTPEGEKAIREKRFKFTSIEFHDNYKDNESGKMFGPTILGGGLTNRPFIKGMKPIAMSEDGKVELEFDEILETEKEDEETMKTLQEIKDEIKKHSEQFVELAKKVKDTPDDKETQKQLGDVTVQLGDLNKALEAAEKTASDRDAELETLRSANVKLQETVNSVSTKLESVMTDREIEKRNIYKERVSRKLSEFKEAGVPPAIIEVVRPILLSDDSERVSVTLEDKDGKKETITLMQTVSKIFEALPADAKVDTGERSRNLQDGTASGGITEVSVDDVRKYADENKISFAEALVELQKKGKISQD